MCVCVVYSYVANVIDLIYALTSFDWLRFTIMIIHPSPPHPFLNIIIFPTIRIKEGFFKKLDYKESWPTTRDIPQANIHCFMDQTMPFEK